MTLQFRQKSQKTQIEELQKEVTLLREYNCALQQQSKSKSEEIGGLSAQISRLVGLEKQWKIGNDTGSILQSKEYLEVLHQNSQIKQECIDIKTKYENLVFEHEELVVQTLRADQKGDRLCKNQQQNLKLQDTIKSYQMKICSLEAQLTFCDKELAELKKKQSGSQLLTKEVFAFQTRISQFQRQLQIKTLEVQNLQREHQAKEDSLRQEIKSKGNTIEELQRQLQDRTESVVNFQREEMTQKDSLLSQIVTLQARNNDYLKQLREKEQIEGVLRLREEEVKKLNQNLAQTSNYSVELMLLQGKNEECAKTIRSKGEEVARAENKLEELSIQIRQKNEEYFYLQRQSLKKDEEIACLKLETADCSSKIGSLEAQIDQLERSLKLQKHTEIIKYVQSEDSILLKHKVEQQNATIISLQGSLNRIAQESQLKIKNTQDLQRRISILEQTNHSLEQELRSSIENQKTSSRITQQKALQDQQLKQTIIDLKLELQEVRSFSQLVRQENDELYLQLEQCRSSNQKASQHKHVKVSRSRSKSPYNGRRGMDKKGLFRPTEVLPFQGETVQTSSRNREYVKTSPLNSNMYRAPSSSNVHVPENDRYNDLQRKIKQLQSENNSLKYKLIE